MQVSYSMISPWLGQGVAVRDLLPDVADAVAAALSSKGWEVRLLVVGLTDEQVLATRLKARSSASGRSIAQEARTVREILDGAQSATGQGGLDFKTLSDIPFWKTYEGLMTKPEKHPDEMLLILGAPMRVQSTLARWFALKSLLRGGFSQALVLIGISMMIWGHCVGFFFDYDYFFQVWAVMAALGAGVAITGAVGAKSRKRRSWANPAQITDNPTIDPITALFLDTCWPQLTPELR